ncbi:MAG: hypothetical protein SPL13_04045 [Clostridia bacterium]|nr:hypothetical protein [Clostridia bacterium]
MVKIIDVDKLFDKYISEYVYSNIGKVNPEQIENKIPELYLEFGDKPLAELDGKTPNTYYKSFSQAELLSALKNHIESGVAVSDFLCEAIESGDIGAVINELLNEGSEEYVNYLLNFIDVSGKVVAKERLFEFIVGEYPDSERELATEILAKDSEEVKETAISLYESAPEKGKECIAEILSGTKPDERVFNILISAFKNNKKKIAMYAGLLGKYGDSRAIDVLKEAAEDEKTNYADFEEIRFNIELLGGEYTGKRDFSTDKLRKKLQEVKNTKIVGDR